MMDANRISACTYPVRDRPLAEALDIIAAAGFRQVDLLGALPHLSLDPAQCNLQAVKAAATARGLAIVNLGTYVGGRFVDPDPAVLQDELAQVERAVDVVAHFGCRSIRVTPGSDDPNSIDAIVPWFQRSAECAAWRGIFLGFETHGGGISGRPELCQELSAKVGSPYFGVLYDPCNMLEYGGEYRQALEIMRDHIVHVHLKDGAHTERGFERTMMGDGQVDFRWIIQRLSEAGYTGHWALEYELKAPPPEVGLGLFRKRFQALTERVA